MTPPIGAPGIATDPRPTVMLASPISGGTGAVPRQARFAQLTYTSFEPAEGGRGGWQVKEESADLSDDERRVLVAGVATGDDGTRGLPSLPTAAELDARPRRLVYAPGPGAGPGGRGRPTAAYWHTTSAGKDASGRPGNVFAHVLLDRNPAAPTPQMRPSDLLYAREWLRPYGVAAVLDAKLAGVSDPPWPNVVVDRTEVVSFLVDEATWRPGLLAALLDAVHTTLTAASGSPSRPVVLVVDNPERGARWIAALCHLMSAGTSRRLYFSTEERVSGVARLADKRLRFAVLPADETARAVADLTDVADLRQLTLIVDGDGTVELGDLPHGVPHRTLPHRGQLAVTAYSVLAASVLAEPELAAAVLQRQDEIAAEVGDDGLPPGWPLALAVLERPDDLGDVQDEAQRLADDAPRELRRRLAAGRAARTPDPTRPVQPAGIGPSVPPPVLTAAEALRRVEMVVDPREFDAVVNDYFRLALGDRGWLVGAERRRSWPSLPVSALDPELVAVACTALDAATAEGTAVVAAGGDPLPVAVHVIRLIDFAFEIGLAEMIDLARALNDAIMQSLNMLVGPLLLDPARGPALVDAAGPVPEPIQRGYLRFWVDGYLDWSASRPDAPPVGRRLPPAVLAWLYPEPPTPPGPDQLADRSAPIPPTLVELAVQVTSLVPDPSAFRALAAWATLDTPGRDLPERLARFTRGPDFSAAELAALVSAYDVLPVVPLLLPSLLRVPDDDALRTTVRRVLSGELEPYRYTDVVFADVLAAARLRRAAADRQPGAATVNSAAAVRELLDAATPFAVAGHALAPDVVDAVLAAWIAESVDAEVEPPERPALVAWVFGEAAPAELVSGAVVEQLTRDRRTEFLTDLAVAAQLGCSDPRAVRAGRWVWNELAKLRAVALDGAEPVLDHLVQRAVVDLAPDLRLDYVQGVRQEVARYVQRDDRLQVQEFFAMRWWQGVGAGEAARQVFSRRR